MPLSPSRWHSTSVAEIELARSRRHEPAATSPGPRAAAAPPRRARPPPAPARARPPGPPRARRRRRPAHARRPRTARRASSTDSAGVRLRATTSTRPSISTHRNSASQSRVAHARHQRGRVVDVAACAVRPRPRPAAPRPRARCGPRSSRPQQLALVALQRAAQVARELLLVRAEAHAGGERLDVALGRRRVRERAGVLVDPERERGRVHRRDRDPALEQQPEHRGHHAAVAGDKRGIARRGLP